MSTYESRRQNSKLYLEQAMNYDMEQRVLTLVAKLERARDMAKALYHHAAHAGGQVNPLLADLVRLLDGGDGGPS